MIFTGKFELFRTFGFLRLFQICPVDSTLFHPFSLRLNGTYLVDNAKKQKDLRKNKPTEMPEFYDSSFAYSKMQITKFSQLPLSQLLNLRYTSMAQAEVDYRSFGSSDVIWNAIYRRRSSWTKPF